MEKTISQEERMRRAEEIYQRRKMSNGNGVRVSSSSVNKNKTKISLFKKMGLQLAICSVIYIIFYLIKNTNYIFSEDVITKTKELLSYDINFGNVYQQVNSFIEQNRDKLEILGIVQKEKNNETVQEEQVNQIENSNEIVDNNEIQVKEIKNEVNTIKEGGIGGAESTEEEGKQIDETKKKTQMEIDAEYVKSKCSFIVPTKGIVTSRYGAREETEIVSANHYGIDIGANTGTAIYASMAGTVTLVSSEGDYRKTC